MTDSDFPLPADYADWLASVQQRIAGAPQRAIVAVNRERVLLYWQIGQQLLTRQERQGWGAPVIDRLAHDLTVAFPAMKRFTPQNLQSMRAFAHAWPEPEFVQQVAAQLPWLHNVALLDLLDNPVERRWYARKALEQRWSRHMLATQIETKLIQRQDPAAPHSAERLAAPPSDLPHATLDDPDLVDFLGLSKRTHARHIEPGLSAPVTRFLLDLRAGFAFVSRQYRIDVGGDALLIDLLFYHLQLRCYVVVDLKATSFTLASAEQLHAYLSAVDAEVKLPQDGPTIGLLLCQEQTRTVAAYALRGIGEPTGSADFMLVRDLPAGLASHLPTIAQIEAELQDAAGDATQP